jgi:septum formation protein
MKNKLYLGSKSQTRQRILNEANIDFILVDQDADEAKCDWGLPLKQLVESIAVYKMQHVCLPEGKENEVCFVLTADTLAQDLDETIQGKPINRDDAIKKIISARSGSRLATAFCLEKRIFISGQWETQDRTIECVETRYIFDIPDQFIDEYLKQTIALKVAGGMYIEEYGCQFLKLVDGSYSTILGLPMYELRIVLQKLGYWNK